jgi:hypothetical protein
MNDLISFEGNRDSWQENFVEPYPIEALGCDGLTGADIAKSLGIAPSDVRKKILSRGFIDRLKTQGFKALTTVLVNKSNDLDYTEVLLDVNASKFFVGKYDSPAGDAYLAFLLKLEQRVAEFDSDVKSDPIMRSLAEGLRLRQTQMRQEERLKVQETKTAVLEDRAGTIEESILDSQLSQVQKRLLKDSIDTRARSLGSIKLVGAIQKDLKEKFGLNKTNDKWYHLAQRHYEEANNFVGRWGY